jgi:chromosome segregation ATPase
MAPDSVRDFDSVLRKGQPMPSTLAPAAAQPEPTLRDILTAVTGLGTEVGELRTEVTGLGTRMDGLETRMDGLETEVGGLRTEVTGLGTRMDGLETRMDGLGTRMDGLETRMDGLGTRMDGLETEVGGLRTEVGGLRTEVGALTTLSRQQFAHTSTELAAVKADCAEMKRQGDLLERKTSEIHAVVLRIEPQVEEAVKLGQDNRRLGRKLQEDFAELDRKLDGHLADHEIHLPRPRTLDRPEAGPIAA